MHPIAFILLRCITLYHWVVLIWIILHTLQFWGIVPRRIASRILYFCDPLVEPVLYYVRKITPAIPSLDLSPLILLLLLDFIRYCVQYYLY